jgi:hypothetical protein
VRRNLLVIGPVVFAAGVGLRFVPSSADLLSLAAATLVAVGFVLITAGILRRWGKFRAWRRSSPVGTHVLVIGLLAFLIFGAWAVRVVVMEVEDWIRVAPIKEALGRDDSRAPLDLAGYLIREEREFVDRRGGAVLRGRIADRLLELGVASRDITSALDEALMTDPDETARRRIAAAFGRLMVPRDALGIVLKLPKLDPVRRARMAEALSARVGKDLGDSPDVWLDWLLADFAGAAPGEAFAMAVEAAKSLSAKPEKRSLCLARIRKGDGADRTQVEILLRDEDARLREAGAMAAAKTGEAAWSPFLASTLKAEKDSETATRLVEALARLDPEGSLRIFLDAARTSRTDAAKAASLAMLSRSLGLAGTEDPALLTAAAYRRMPPGASKRETLEDLARIARESETARSELLLILKTGSEPGYARSRALKAILENAPVLLPSGDLVALFEGTPDPDFAQNVRSELRRRTSRDGGTDPAVWREILDQLK